MDYGRAMARSAARPSKAGRAAHDPKEKATDGRVQRGARNRAAIVDAMLELIGDGELSPTAEQVAERAEVGLRTVFRHFRDMDSLYAEMHHVMAGRLVEGLDIVPPIGTLEERLVTMTTNRCKVFERIAPYRRAGDRVRARSPFLQQAQANATQLQRSILESVIPELEGDTLEAIDLMLSFESWNRLRDTQRLSAERTRRIMTEAVLALVRRG